MNRVTDLAQRITNVMAYDRETFKNRVREKLDGALIEFYKARIAELNGQTRWVQHWDHEVERLITIDLAAVLLRPIKGRWNRRKAVAEVVAELRGVDSAYRRLATNAVKRYYGLKKIRHSLPQQTTDEFYRLVDEAVDETLAC